MAGWPRWRCWQAWRFFAAIVFTTPEGLLLQPIDRALLPAEVFRAALEAPTSSLLFFFADSLFILAFFWLVAALLRAIRSPLALWVLDAAQIKALAEIGESLIFALAALQRMALVVSFTPRLSLASACATLDPAAGFLGCERQRPDMKIIQTPSPNFNDRLAGVDLLLLHYTGMKSGKEALERLCDPAAHVSAHYLIEEDGRVIQLVSEDKRAWHAGRSHWAGESDINSRSIGIEIVNPGHEFGYRAFLQAQIDAVIALCQEILQRWSIPAVKRRFRPSRIDGQLDSQTAGIAAWLGGAR